MRHLLDTKIGDYQAMVPMVDIDTIGAGGGSIAYVDQGGVGVDDARALRVQLGLQLGQAALLGDQPGLEVLPLRHRLRRNPLDDAGSTTRVDRAVTALFGT